MLHDERDEREGYSPLFLIMAFLISVGVGLGVTYAIAMLTRGS
jgi:hypothetical protein